VFASIVFMYLGPNTMGAATTALVHTPRDDVAGLSGATAGLLMVLAAVVLIYRVAVRAPPVTTKQESSDDAPPSDGAAATGFFARNGAKVIYANEREGEPFLEAFGPFVDAARSMPPLRVRAYALEDVVAASAAACLAGIRPASSACLSVAGAMTCVAAAHLLYLLVVRPLKAQLEMGFALLFGASQLVLTVLCAAATKDASVVDYLGVVVLVQAASFFVQAGVLACWAYVRHERKQRLALLDPSLIQPQSTAASALLVPIQKDSGEATDNSDDNEDDDESSGVANPLADRASD
jgi:hypothetical protein